VSGRSISGTGLPTPPSQAVRHRFEAGAGPCPTSDDKSVVVPAQPPNGSIAPNGSVAPNASLGYHAPGMNVEAQGTTTEAPGTAGTTLRAKKGGSITPVEAKSSQGTSWRSEERTQFLIDTVGGVNKLAKTLGVSPSQPSRWKTGAETPSPQVAAKLLDLDHVIALAVQTWDAAVVMDWMTSSNGFLGGARPIDVLLQRGSAEVIDALRATLSGAYP